MSQAKNQERILPENRILPWTIPCVFFIRQLHSADAPGFLIQDVLIVKVMDVFLVHTKGDLRNASEQVRMIQHH